MGFDISGVNPISETGSYFRNNVWWWRPLWGYCEHVCADLLSGSYNDGHEYDKDVCDEMARLLEKEISNGNCEKYAKEYKEWQENLPKEPCMRCDGNNYGHNKKKECKTCDKTGENENWNASYPFDVDNVKEFVSFLKDSGGMEVF